ncbi:MAG TPA: endonuclease/exonuclease/phosphatase family protein, partial [Planctomycetaceae bacterium]|nr:endonuclease/exonuclease/phosphatase family protein [Planctomycetaceae bacterium]
TLREVADLAPDIILSQESPGKQSVAALAGELFGEVGASLAGPDAAILVRGRIMEHGVPAGAPGNAVWARVKLASGPEVLVVSLRLEPCPIRFDLWSADCWSSQRANRQLRRRQLAAILEALPEARGIPVIVGGDFNAPAGDPVFRAFPRGFRDAFREAGRGWGDTIVNQVPMQRIDQIWIDRGLLAANAGALRTINSDHRLVWADLWLPTSP